MLLPACTKLRELCGCSPTDVEQSLSVAPSLHSAEGPFQRHMHVESFFTGLGAIDILVSFRDLEHFL